ncbi:MAG: ComEA family DNA-binding protein [Pseudomonadota bacterium]
MKKLKPGLLALVLLFLPLLSFAAKVNINSASAEELAALNGIGDAKAAAIVAYRTDNGSFASVDDLAQVSGIGDKTLDGLRDSVTVSD